MIELTDSKSSDSDTQAVEFCNMHHINTTELTP